MFLVSSLKRDGGKGEPNLPRANKTVVVANITVEVPVGWVGGVDSTITITRAGILPNDLVQNVAAS